MHTHYREQDGERDEAEDRRDLQCSVSMIPGHFHAPLTLAITETYDHSQLKLGSVDMCLAKNSNSVEEMEKDTGMWRVSAIT